MGTENGRSGMTEPPQGPPDVGIDSVGTGDYAASIRCGGGLCVGADPSNGPNRCVRSWRQLARSIKWASNAPGASVVVELPNWSPTGQ